MGFRIFKGTVLKYICRAEELEDKAQKLADIEKAMNYFKLTIKYGISKEYNNSILTESYEFISQFKAWQQYVLTNFMIFLQTRNYKYGKKIYDFLEGYKLTVQYEY
ncbi:MAG: hypothetical protein ACI4V7_07915 [Succinivibrionaceae bacterium]